MKIAAFSIAAFIKCLSTKCHSNRCKRVVASLALSSHENHNAQRALAQLALGNNNAQTVVKSAAAAQTLVAVNRQDNRGDGAPALPSSAHEEPPPTRIWLYQYAHVLVRTKVPRISGLADHTMTETITLIQVCIPEKADNENAIRSSLAVIFFYNIVHS